MPADRPLYLGIDLGGTNMQIGVVDAAGNVLSRAKRKTDSDEGPSGIFDRITSGCQEAAQSAGVQLADIVAAGLGAPGAADPERGIVYHAPNIGWVNTPAAEMLQQKLGRPVTLDNDVNVAAWGEFTHGAARGARDILAAWVGTGVGGGIILDGRLVYGHFKTAGEIGHIRLRPENPPGMRRLEHLCSRTAVANRIRHMIELNRPSIVPELVEGKLHKIKSKTIADAYARNDPVTVEIVNDSADRLGIALGGLVTVLSLEMVVLGGGLTEALGKPYVDRVATMIREVAFPEVCQQVKVVATELLDNAGVIGAAMIARDRLG